MPDGINRSSFHKVETIIFDSDGVITTEREYWNAAELTILELLYGDQWVGLENERYSVALHKPGAAIRLLKFVNPEFSELLKSRRVISNWDLTYFAAALYLLELLRAAPRLAASGDFAREGLTGENLRRLGQSLPDRKTALPEIGELAGALFETADAVKKTGDGERAAGGRADLVAALNVMAEEKCGITEPLFSGDDSLMTLCKTLFQEWFLGDGLYEEHYGKKTSRIPKDGLMQFESPILPIPAMIDVLSMLREAGIALGVATGRPRVEALAPLERWGLLHFFDEKKIATNREITEAEEFLTETGRTRSLAKPHPYIYLKALYPEKTPGDILALRLPLAGAERVLIVGDTVADVAAAKKIGAQSALVYSGVKNLENARELKKMNPDFLIENVTGLKDLF
ncbi:MAG: HAD family hydrolase [bacterium]